MVSSRLLSRRRFSSSVVITSASRPVAPGFSMIALFKGLSSIALWSKLMSLDPARSPVQKRYRARECTQRLDNAMFFNGELDSSFLGVGCDQPFHYLRTRQHGQPNLAKLHSLREKLRDWDDAEQQRVRLFRELDGVFGHWVGQLPNLRDFLRPEQIDWLLSRCVADTSATDDSSSDSPGERFVEFVARTGYRDDRPIEVDAAGKPSLSRTTAVHQAAKSDHLPNRDIVVRELFKIYDRFEANYVDRASGLTHFHVACKYGCVVVAWKFLELGQDPDLRSYGSVDPPLHLALAGGHRRLAELLLKRRADPNLTNDRGETPLHVICSKKIECDLAKWFLEINDGLRRQVRLDAIDARGRTALHWAVASIAPNAVDLLLSRGADLARFQFPTERFFDERFSLTDGNLSLRMRLASGALIIVELLKNRGYELKRSEVTAIMTLFRKLRLFEKSTDFAKYRHDSEWAENRAKKIMISSSASLHDLICGPREEAEKRITPKDVFEFARSHSCYLIDRYTEACVARLCETMSRGFFRRWALGPFRKLIHGRLSIECCDLIIANLKNDDLFNIFLAIAMKILNVAAVPTKILILIWKIFIFDLGSDMLRITLAIITIDHRLKKIVQVLSITLTKSLFNKEKKKIHFIWLGTQHGLRVVQSKLTRDQLPDLRDTFRPEEIENILMALVKYDSGFDGEGDRFIEFVARIGCYKDQPQLDEEGKPLLRRTTSVHYQSEDGNQRTVENLFKIYNRFDVNYIDDDEFTHFHVACEFGCVDVVEKFLELGQDPNCLAQTEVAPPLYWSLSSNRKRMIPLLLSRGADPNLPRPCDGSSALHAICKRKVDDDMIEIFFKAIDDTQQTVQIDARDNDNRTHRFNWLRRIIYRTRSTYSWIVVLIVELRLSN
ncbi:unnamed protein product [Trichogramma brassicae]|uniref:Uncharacterized protein n=1 Tax=Trichogramma brassicae TaxID=86971 RepID=A0A6H5ISD8_9HYME|nr:unnamed protein product [Trichogramma brassicae]